MGLVGIQLAVIPHQYNYLINPNHLLAQDLIGRLEKLTPDTFKFEYDPRALPVRIRLEEPKA